MDPHGCLLTKRAAPRRRASHDRDDKMALAERKALDIEA
jgi:hypothetical protein